jgi:hypothetical protein
MRASEQRRERTVARLGEGYAAGSLGTETFALRVDHALAARSDRELRWLVADLPPLRLRERIERFLTGVRERPPTVRIAPPPDGPGPWTIGRSDACRLVVGHRTVSRLHAELRPVPGGWEVRDLGSLNGTRVNGWRVVHARLHPGDELRLGDVRVQL